MNPSTSSTNNPKNTNYTASASNEPINTPNVSNNNSIQNTQTVASNDVDLADEEAAREMITKQYKKTPKSGGITNDNNNNNNGEVRPLSQEEIDEQVKK